MIQPVPPSSVEGQQDLRTARLRECFFHWFAELEAQGEDTSFLVGHLRGESGQPLWTTLPHHSFDGLGGLSHLLARSGQALELPMLPTPHPPRSARRAAAWRVLFRRAPRLRAWVEEKPVDRGIKPAAAWIVLSAEETGRLRQVAKSQRLSMNALLLWGLTAALRPLLREGPGVVEWVVPMNMRGAEPALAPTSNQAATLDVWFEAGAPASVIDERLREELTNNAHWGVWQLLGWLGLFGPRWVRAVARRELSVKKHGSFSNLGNLRAAGHADATREPEWWMVFNPVQRTRPIGAACLTWNGRLALTVQVHPVLGVDAKRVTRLVCEWVSILGASAGERSGACTTDAAG